MRAHAFWLLIGVGCAQAPTLTIEPLSVETCRAHCVSSVTVELDGNRAAHVCGQRIELGVLEGDGAHHLVITATGAYGLRAEADVLPIAGQATELQMRFESERRPIIQSVAITSGEAALYGESELSITGQAFGAGGPRATVSIDGVAVPVVAWTDAEIRVRTAKGGSIVVTQCGIGSEPLLSRPKEVRFTEVELAPVGCVQPHLTALASVTSASGIVTGIVSCRDPCSTARVVQFPSATPQSIVEVAAVEGCPIDVAQTADDLIFASTEAGLYVCSGAGTLACVLRSDQGRYETLVRAQPAGAAAIHRPMGSATRQLRFEGEGALAAGSGVIRPDELSDVRAIDARFALGIGAQGQSVLVHWAAPAPGTVDARVTLNSCTEPRALHRYRSADGQERLVAVCGVDGDLFLRFFEVGPNGMITTVGDPLLLAEPVPIDLAVDLAGEILWIWEPDALVFVSLESLASIGRMPLGPGYSGRRLVRADGSDRFYLGGPGRSRLTFISVE